MKIILEIGSKRVDISSYEMAEGDRKEADLTWGEIMKELVFPALIGHGYVFNDDFIEEIEETHHEYLRKRR